MRAGPPRRAERMAAADRGKPSSPASRTKPEKGSVHDPRLKPYHLLPPKYGTEVSPLVHGAETRRQCSAAPLFASGAQSRLRAAAAAACRAHTLY